ncbi:MAG: 30S ribosomal protein S12 methylthiotransferase RimO [Alphaproteobacteria bacterium]|nr:30S ribosomal protein S12 methylthiotransferase RimO [Alphaproteobacteria bacterium]NDC56311.1 30S ribosomal protein S12 methylthiotransferase RimO [Alphaproteobacteria bacterium]NDG04181.1 30S ribosomal protein S12 methylthiotransferase RimO [Alphaproteobacteria bacterium]
MPTAARRQGKIPTIGMVSLGCPKALVDSERILSQLRAEGYAFSPDYAGADVVIVNTCGFLESARDESLQAIGEAMAENGRVIVTGCLGAEPKVIEEKFPHVLAITGPQQYETVVAAVHKAVPPQHDPKIDLLPPGGIKLTPRHYAYVKISEGCNHRCRFCIIPSMRGDLVSRPLPEVMREAEKLVQAGVKELLIISQDTSAYGTDVKYQPAVWKSDNYDTRFTHLCRALGTLGVWVRLHYVYPYPHVSDVMPLMAEGKILPYLDIPFQHASPSVLRAMKRPAAQEKTLERIAAWRQQVPHLTLRSTFIVGFPGETDDDFDQLLQWLTEAQLDRVGCFRYENVSGAAANDLPDHVPDEVKEERWQRLMQHQQNISAARLAKKKGTVQQVLVDHVDDKKIVGRTWADAPEIDGHIQLPPTKNIKPGDYIMARVTKTHEYDLMGEHE